MNSQQILNALNNSGNRKHLVSKSNTLENKEFLLRFKHYATGLSLDSGVDHTIITFSASEFYPGNNIHGRIMLAVYDLMGGIETILRAGSRYHDLDIYFPTGKLANRLGSELIKLGEVPDVRAMGNASPQDGLKTLKDYLNRFSNSLKPAEIGYHADTISEETFLKGGLISFFRNINSLPIEELTKEPVDTKKFKEKIVYA